MATKKELAGAFRLVDRFTAARILRCHPEHVAKLQRAGALGKIYRNQADPEKIIGQRSRSTCFYSTRDLAEYLIKRSRKNDFDTGPLLEPTPEHLDELSQQICVAVELVDAVRERTDSMLDVLFAGIPGASLPHGARGAAQRAGGS